MLLCGCEEPIQTSGQIHLLDEATGRGVLSSLVDERLNRYSFIWLGPQEAWKESSSSFAQLMRAILTTADTTATWVGAYSVARAGRIRHEWFAKRRAKEGWAIYRDEALIIANSPPMQAGDFSTEDFRPPNEVPHDPPDDLLLFVGPFPPLDTLGREPVRPSMDWFARQGELWPSRAFLTWLADSQYTIAYKARSVGGWPGLIIVGTLRIPAEQLLEQGAIQEINKGDDADQVWRHSPSYGY